MAATIEAIEASIRDAVALNFRGKLLAKGQARSMIWRDGVLPEDAPPFSNLLSYNLISYGYGLLSHGLRLLEGNGDREVARIAFEHAAGAIEAVIAKGRKDEARDFHRLVAAAAYHLGRYSARAYSLLQAGFADANLSPPEQCLGRLMLRDLDGLDAQIKTWRLHGRGADDTLVELLGQFFPKEDEKASPPAEDLMSPIDLALADNFMGAMGTTMLAFERGERELLETAMDRLRLGLEGSGEFNLVPQWWCHRLTIHLLDDLWDSSFHRRLPSSPSGSEPSDWAGLRNLFIASLYQRSRAEIELWPSQLDAVTRALNLADNMVVSLPTSAGKTRIAELCILACLAAGRRAVFVTPLRALSAQTEVGLRRTFKPLGKTVSSLYGSIGVSDVDENILRDCDIVVATPEKLDFALRNEPDLLNDVGLVVLDEGHMIGLGDREIRYEVQIQRLLKRADASSRRIVCLSAILPDGTELEDFVAWLTGDKPGGLLQKNWRPTRLRFGEVEWRGSHARLNIQVGDEKPYVRKFLTAHIPPVGRRPTPFPRNQRELCLATAWRLVEDGQSVLIFCPLRKSVEPFAKAIIDLHKRGALSSVLEHDEAVLATALAIGAEWFGPGHALLKCLKLGVAIHHGALPTPYRKEVERLLRDGVLKITISSPTLAQGLNLSATTLIVHGLVRKGKVIESSEFRNVAGRAGRAYVDLEGLVLYPMFDDHRKRREHWNQLVANDVGREMESGLLRLLATLLLRMQKKLRTKTADKLVDYVVNNANAWTFPKLPTEGTKEAAAEKRSWEQYLTNLDTAILSMLGEQEVADDEIEGKIDAILESSLFVRRLARHKEIKRMVLRRALVERARYVWVRSTPTQRRGYFLAGVGLDSGQQLDTHAAVLGNLLVQADSAVQNNEYPEAVEAITAFAEIIFQIPPFLPDDLPHNWKAILAAWLNGEAIVSLTAGNQDEVLHFIEQGLVYRLPWGMEAVRVRGLAHDDPIGEDFTMSDFELGAAVAAVETGSLDRSAALLMRSGFTSRSSAIKVVRDTGGAFTTPRELRRWLKSTTVSELGKDETWPTPESRKLWEDFVQSFDTSERTVWSASNQIADVRWADGLTLAPGTALRITDGDAGNSLVLTADYRQIGMLKVPVNPARRGLLLATSGAGPQEITLEYFGPKDLYLH
ncbi:DEAD/DEAH box helicase [Rhodospirillaceae bacterium SYSU D60014]|uniref:DEAD/DEAH box helicase n=1 Tax=Virgifigura deserti TaxID=2268457 RepID=UPI000E66D20A